MIDEDGFRPNIGIIIINRQGQVFWAKRTGQNAWQFPQGGVNDGEEYESAMFRELQEETGLLSEHVKILDYTRGWLRYRLPKRLVRSDKHPVCVGQKQKWFLLEFLGKDSDFNLKNSDYQEFDEWQWTSYWYPLSQIVTFKKEVYRRALKELAPTWIELQSNTTSQQNTAHG